MFQVGGGGGGGRYGPPKAAPGGNWETLGTGKPGDQYWHILKAGGAAGNCAAKLGTGMGGQYGA